jgi:competence protein ComEC
VRPSENASAARTCLAAAAVIGILSLIVCVIVALALLPVDIIPQPPTQPPDRQGTVEVTQDLMTVAVMDVGQALSVVVVAPDGTSLVYDAGRSGDRVESLLIPYLHELGVDEIDYLVLSHPDQDHIGGMPRLLDRMTVHNFVDPVIPTTSQTYQHVLERIIRDNVNPIRAVPGLTLDLGPGVRAEFLWPEQPFIMDSGEPDSNENSAVLQISFGDVRFLLTGDIESEAEATLVERYTNDQLQSDVLVVAHHGSRTSSSAAFLDAVKPSVAVIPVGFNNPYGHPHDEVMVRLRFRGLVIHRTDFDGTIEFITDGERFTTTVDRTSEDGN